MLLTVSLYPGIAAVMG